MKKALRVGLSFGVPVSVLAAGMSGPAMAQEPSAEAQSSDASASEATNSTASPEILVTAQRRAERLQDVPVSISVMKGEELRSGNIQNLVDFSVHLPAVKLVQVNQTDFLNIRGVGSGNNPGFQQSVGAFVDDVYLERARAIRAGLFDVEQVEVLKGPQTLYFGNNAIAGALNITTRKPSKSFDYDASVLYAPTGGQRTFLGGVTLPVSDTLSVRFAGRLSAEDGLIYNSFLQEHGPNSNEAAGRVSLRWEPSTDFRSDLRVEGSKFHATNSTPYEVLNCPPDPAYGPAAGACAKYIAATRHTYDGLTKTAALFPTFAKYRNVTAAWTNSYSLGDVSLHSVTSYFRQHFENLVQLIPTTVPGTSGGGGLPGNNLETYRDVAQELRAQSDTNGPFDFMVGGYYAKSHLNAPYCGAYYFLPAGAAAAPTYSATTPIAACISFRQSEQTLSGFGSATVRPFAGLQITGGLRYSNVEKDAARSAVVGTNGSIPSPSTLVPGPPAVQALLAPSLGLTTLGNFANPHREDHSWQPSVRVQYDFSHDVMTYASYSKGFKAGGFDGTTAASRFDPESVNSYEVGLKSSWLDRRLTLNLVGFYAKYTNLQETSKIFLSNGAVINSVANAATSIAKGIELQTAARLSSAFSVNADLTYLDSHYRSFPNGVCTILQQAKIPNCVQNLSGKRRAYSPTWSGNIGLSYVTALTGDLKLRVLPSAYFTTKFFEGATADPLLLQAGNIKFDTTIAIGPESGRWELAVIGKNLTDKLTASYRAGISTAPGSVYASVDPPRTVAVQLTVRY